MFPNGEQHGPCSDFMLADSAECRRRAHKNSRTASRERGANRLQGDDSMTLGELQQFGIELELVPPGNSLRIVKSSQPITPEQRSAIVSFLPGLLAELRLRERNSRGDFDEAETTI